MKNLRSSILFLTMAGVIDLLHSEPAHAQRCTRIEVPINIVSEPAGATVTLDPYGSNRLLGVTPLHNVCVHAAVHTLRFHLDGYGDVDLEAIPEHPHMTFRAAMAPGGPSECAALASTEDYPTTRIGPIIAALQQASQALGDVLASCPTSEVDGAGYAFRGESCRASVDRCQTQMASALAMENSEDRGYEVRMLHVLTPLLSQPIGSHHFSVPPEWNTHQIHHIIGGDWCDPSLHYDEIAERHDGYSVDANYYRQVERTYQQWWDWVRGVCHMTR